MDSTQTQGSISTRVSEISCQTHECMQKRVTFTFLPSDREFQEASLNPVCCHQVCQRCRVLHQNKTAFVRSPDIFPATHEPFHHALNSSNQHSCRCQETCSFYGK